MDEQNMSADQRKSPRQRYEEREARRKAQGGLGKSMLDGERGTYQSDMPGLEGDSAGLDDVLPQGSRRNQDAHVASQHVVPQPARQQTRSAEAKRVVRRPEGRGAEERMAAADTMRRPASRGAMNGADAGDTTRHSATRGASGRVVANEGTRRSTASGTTRRFSEDVSRRSSERPAREPRRSTSGRRRPEAGEERQRRATDEPRRPSANRARRADVAEGRRPAAADNRRPARRSDGTRRQDRMGASQAPDKQIERVQDEFALENVSPEHRERVGRVRDWAIRGFAGIMTLGLVIGLLFFARPTASALEKRELTSFPPFTVEGVLDGSFFSGVSTWYADTYPLREQLVALDQWMESFFGIQTDTMMVGGNTVADDLPDENADTTAANAETAAKKKVDPPSAEAMSEEIQNSIMDGLYVENGAAYSIYYFVQESVETYAGALNLAAERLDGTTKVYSILVPNNSGAMLSEETLAGLGGTDQQAALDYFNSLYSDKVTSIETLQTLRSHNSEYLYFRTDHHWTALGAFYVYRNFCEAIGETPHDLSDYQTVRFAPFLGTFYDQLGLDSMAANPDYVDAYYPISTNDMTYWNEDGVEIEHNVITDVSGWNQNSLYNTFVAGDEPLSMISNPQKTDGSSCVLVKDSFGCCFAPYLVDHYQTVYIIDFRYYSGNIVDFCKENNIDDLIFLNNMTMATATSVGEMILSEVQES